MSFILTLYHIIMVKPNRIKHLYRKHPLTDENRQDLELSRLLTDSLSQHLITIGKENIIINSVEEESPFRELPIKNIAGIEDLDQFTAIILRNSILFLSKFSTDIHVHINVEQPSFWQRLKYYFSNEDFE